MIPVLDEWTILAQGPAIAQGFVKRSGNFHEQLSRPLTPDRPHFCHIVEAPKKTRFSRRDSSSGRLNWKLVSQSVTYPGPTATTRASVRKPASEYRDVWTILESFRERAARGERAARVHCIVGRNK